MLRWMFLDLDSYFAGVEQQLRVELRGRAVGVVPVESKGTCCIAASREAKRRGVKTGTKVADAERLCPGIELVKARPALYIAVHQRLVWAIETVLPVDKVWSIDEVAIRLRAGEREPSVVRRLAERVKAAVGEALEAMTGEYARTRWVASPPASVEAVSGLVVETDAEAWEREWRQEMGRAASSTKTEGMRRKPRGRRAAAWGAAGEVGGEGGVLTCTVGVASTRLLAKAGSELGKPDGLVVLDDAELPGRFVEAGWAVEDFPGISDGMKARLFRRGVTTVEGLWALSEAEMRDTWGSVEGRRYWCGLHGLEVPDQKTVKRMVGHANVLSPDLRTEAGAHAMVTRLLHKAAARLRADGYLGTRLSVAVTFVGDSGWADEIAVPACQDTLTLVEHLERLWARKGWGHGVGAPQNLSASVGLGAGWGGAGSAWGAVERLRERMGDGRYRRTGAVRAGQPLRVAVTVSGLTPVTATAGNLFAQAEDRRGLGGVMDAINTRFGGHTLYLGGMHAIADREMEDKIAFGRVPDERVGI
ncbi:MAG: hypothetical protein AAGI68_07925 [Planctomycetota bacterium]